jgi:predicted nucleotidyltransferase
VLRWPDREAVRTATGAWAAEIAARPGVTRVGYFGSLVKGTWGVGSDVDLVVIVDRSPQPVYRRGLEYDALELPVPADVLVFTTEEWDRLSAAGREPLGPVEWIDPT